VALSGWLYQANCDGDDCQFQDELQLGEGGTRIDDRGTVCEAFVLRGWTFDEDEFGAEYWFCPECSEDM
jgi:hypothetical protein